MKKFKDLSVIDTQRGIKLLRDNFEDYLAKNLNLTRVSAPLFVTKHSGINDDLNGVETPIEFEIDKDKIKCQILHSLAKWKRMALYEYNFKTYEGLYTNMNAIRKCEDLDDIHSCYVDQWDWEKIITAKDRNVSFLKKIVTKIVDAMYKTQTLLHKHFPSLIPVIGKEVFFITTQELEDKYPNLSTKDREHAICKLHQDKTIFVMQVGHLLRSKIKHDGRAPDYDDWNLNGDIIIWYPPLNKSVELSSMGVRVDSKSLLSQLKLSDSLSRLQYDYHKMIKGNKLPLTIGGGVGQSRLSLVLLNKRHIGQVQSSVWPKRILEETKKQKITLL